MCLRIRILFLRLHHSRDISVIITLLVWYDRPGELLSKVLAAHVRPVVDLKKKNEDSNEDSTTLIERVYSIHNEISRIRPQKYNIKRNKEDIFKLFL